MSISARLSEEDAEELNETVDLLDSDKSDVIRDALREGLRELRVRRATERYQAGDVSTNEAARLAGVSLAEWFEIANERGLTVRLSPAELERLDVLDGPVRIPEAVFDEVTTQPARGNLHRFLEKRDAVARSVSSDAMSTALGVLDDEEPTDDAVIVAAVIEATDPIGVVSDDERVRATADGLGATVTGTLGVVVRAVESYDTTASLSATEAKTLVRRLDDNGLHTTGALRERTFELIDDVASRRG